MSGLDGTYYCPECKTTYGATEAEDLAFTCSSKSCVENNVQIEKMAAPALELQEQPEEKAEAPKETTKKVEEPATETAVKTEPKSDAAFICPSCSKEYSVAEADRVGSFCSEPDCEELMILLEKLDEEAEIDARQDMGLGILVCDVSGSMEDFPFKDRRVSKLSLVSGSVARGIWDLVEQMEEIAQKSAYISIIYFSKSADMAKDKAGKPFLKSIFEIGQEFSSPRDFSDFLAKGMRQAQKTIPGNMVSELVFGKDNTKFYTNITSGLQLAHKLKDACLSGNLADYDGPSNIKVIEDVCINPLGESVPISNVRCLIYSDGAHNYPKDSEVENPFAADEQSLLITSYFGKNDDKGSKQMSGLSANCPKHGDSSFFLIDSADGYQKLRGLFRMSSGVSGFCPSCMPKDF